MCFTELNLRLRDVAQLKNFLFTGIPIMRFLRTSFLTVSVQLLGKAKQTKVILARQRRHLLAVYHSLS
jgi:hypothetical protein